MATRIAKLRPVQNIGLNDRIIRGVIAFIIIGYPFLNMQNEQYLGGELYLIFIGLYPALTAILGWDPIYTLINYRTCGAGHRNPCGTFPYEMASAMGHTPVVDKEHAYDHSIAASKVHDESTVETLTPRVSNILLVIATLILAIAVIVLIYWGPK
jgi:hypothetical protein